MSGSGKNEITAPEDGGRKKLFTRTDAKGYIVFFSVLIFTAAVVAGIFALIPHRGSGSGDRSNDGAGRSFMFPFVFQNDRGSLYVLNDARSEAVEIDDSAGDAVHVASSGTVYYLREGVLYEYSIAKNRRVAACEGVRSWTLSGDLSFAVFTDTDGALKIYNGKTVVDIYDGNNAAPDAYFVCGKETVLYLRDYSPETGEASLYKADKLGNSVLIASGVNARERFAPANGDKYICYYKGSELYVSDVKGDVITSVENGFVIDDTQSSVLFDTVTAERDCDGNLKLRYIYSPDPAETDEASAKGSIYYFNGRGIEKTAGNVRKIIFSSYEDNLLIYSAGDGGEETVFRAGKKGRTERLFAAAGIARFMYDRHTGYLYYQKEDGSLWRVNIYSSSLTENLVAEVSSGLYKYVRKPFAVFTVDGSGEIHIVHNSNTFIEYDSLKEKRLYGLDDNNYLLLRVHGENQISLDIVVDGAYTRLSSDTDPNVYFDSRLEYVIYCSGNELCLWNGGTSQAKGSFGRITSVDIAGGDN